MTSNTKDHTDVSSAAVSVKLPPFWPQAPKLWFAQAEAQFHLRHVASSLTRYYYTIASLPENIATDVDDLLTPTTEDPYSHLKSQLLLRFGTTTEDRFRVLMQSTSGDAQKPTQVLREMRRAADTFLDPNSPLLERLFLERLPPNIRLLLKAGSHTSLDALAVRADELIEINDAPSSLVWNRKFAAYVYPLLVESLNVAHADGHPGGGDYLTAAGALAAKSLQPIVVSAPMAECVPIPEAVPITDISAETIVRVFLATWVARFGVPVAITTDQGRQFTSDLWRTLSEQLGMKLQCTTAHHPQANASRWTDSLPLVLLGIRSAVKQDIRHCPAELVYGSSLRLPGAYFAPFRSSRTSQPACRAKLQSFFEGLSATPTRRPGLHRAWNEGTIAALDPVYDGPFLVLAKTRKTVTVEQKGKPVTVSIDRVKPAFYTSPPTERTAASVTFCLDVDVIR
uniref:Integrase catalytic domain-containing protein n=1 Tax=Trichuris muris TaxID=70415 RepID=A0A5S6R059_TRIMR